MLHRILTGILLLSLATSAIAEQGDNKQDKQDKQDKQIRKQEQDDHKQNDRQDKQDDKSHKKDKLTDKVSVTLSLNSVSSNLVAPGTVQLQADAQVKQPSRSIARVEFYAGTTLMATDTAAPYTYQWSNVPARTYTLTARAINDKGDIADSNPVSVNINAPPTVSITAPINNTALAAPATFNLTANASDSDGSIIKVEYYAGTTLIGTATTAPYSYTWNNVSGIHNVTAVATDNLGATSTSAPINLIADIPPGISITAPANGTVMTAPASFNLSANAEASATGGAITKVEFYQNNQLLSTVTNTPYSYNWNNVVTGNYSVTAKAYDSYGISTISTAVTLTTNSAPTVNLVSPLEGARYIAPATITLNANAADSDGTISQVEFYQGNALLATVTTAPYTYNWSNAQPGNYSLTAKVTDNHGAITTSPAVNIIVNANQAPVISLGTPAPNASFTAPANIQLTANATDTDGSIAQVAFYEGTTLLGTVTASPYVFDWNNIAIGSYTLSAIATDNLGLSTASASVQITVSSGVAQVYYIHTDQLDTPRLITDANNTPVWRWDSTDPFANNPVNDDPNSTGRHFTFNQRFPGQYYDVETNTHYNYYRDYDPSTGRYIQSDPIGLEGGINTYAYVEGNPMSYVDPEGLAPPKKGFIDDGNGNILSGGGRSGGGSSSSGAGNMRAGGGGANSCLPQLKNPPLKDLKPFQGKTKTNGETGKDRRYYEKDYTHKDVEVYDRNGNHLGSMDPQTGDMTKPPVPGRKIGL